MNAPRVKLTELREYRSERTGNTYFAGYLGRTRVVMLRDDRAECTGKEVARWNVLLEEPEPREERQDRASGAQGGRGASRVSAGSSERSGGRFRPRQGPSAQPVPRRRSEGTAADRAAGELLRDLGTDEAAMSRDEVPF